MQNFLVTHTVGDIIKDSFRIYFGNFWVLFMINALVSVPFQTLHNAGQFSGEPELMAVGIFLSLFAALFAFSATTIAVSDICLGNKPSIALSYSRVGEIFGKLIVTYVFLIIVYAVGLVLLVVPFFIFLAWYYIVLSVFVLEKPKVLEGFKRSRTLGKEFYLRNIFAAFLTYIIALVYTYAVGFAIGIFLGLGGIEIHLLNEVTWIVAFIVSVVDLAVMPVVGVAIVLIYYDMRVRKEAFDSEGLTQSLSR